MADSIEALLARNCAPALAGIKPANLVACPREEVRALLDYRPLLAQKDISVRCLCACKKRFLFLVYRPRLLERRLSQTGARDCLRAFSYPENAPLDALLDRLARRVRTEPDFPHEIGLFLGYPLEDVTGFIREKGRNCKCSGHWKVYGDPALAKRLFRAYDRCTQFFCGALERGVPFPRLLQAAPAA